MNAKNLYKIISVLCTISILSLTGCPSQHPPESEIQPEGLTILGLDGATWEVIDHLIGKGELPGFKRLKEEGVYGSLETFLPTESVSIWTSIASGVSPAKHGIQTFTRRIPGTDKHVPSPGTDRRVPALWNMVSDKEKSVVAVKWFASWPAEEVNGAILSPRLEAEDAEPRTYPIELFREIDQYRYMSTMDNMPQPPLPGKQAVDPAKKPAKVMIQNPRNGPPMLTGQSQVQTKMFDDTSVWLAGKHVYQTYQPDLFMLYLKSTDRVQHFLWGAHFLENTDEIRKAEAEAIYGWYRFYDDIILELLEDESRALMVISDHGFRSLEEVPEPYHIWDIDFDQILEFCGFLTKTGRKTSWSETLAYTYRPYPYDNAVEFRLNLLGREPEGVVIPEESSSAISSLTQALNELRTKRNEPLFMNVTPSINDSSILCLVSDQVRLSDSVCYLGDCLDLRKVIFQKGLPRGIHPDAPPGIIAMKGPGISKGRSIQNAHVFDIAPTSLHVLNLPVARDFDGSVLQQAFTSDFLAAYPIKYISSYGQLETIDALTTTQGDSRMLDELRALGYIQ